MNLKNVIIPASVENSVNISDITDDFRGIILVFSKDTPIGCILYLDYSWRIWNSICDSHISEKYDHLIELVKDYPNYTYKVIEFDKV